MPDMIKTHLVESIIEKDIIEEKGLANRANLYGHCKRSHHVDDHDKGVNSLEE